MYLCPKMNTRQLETAVKWLSQWPKKQPILLITGQSASGKTTLAHLLLHDRVVKEINGFDSKIPRDLKLLGSDFDVKTVADMAGLSYGPKFNTVLVEDAEFCDLPTLRTIVSFAKAAIMPVVCICGDSRPIDYVLTGVSLQLRLCRPTVNVAAEILSPSIECKVGGVNIDRRLAARVAERCNCDIRQSKIELQMIRTTGEDLGKGSSGVDKDSPTAFDSITTLFPYRSLAAALNLMDTDPTLPMMVAENYVKVKDLKPCDMADAADEISAGDLYPSDVAELLTVAAAPYHTKKGLTSRSVYPSIISRTATAQANRRKMPKGVDYTTINAVENRIVKTLARGVAAAAVAREMRSMGLTKIAHWENVRDLAPIGKVPVKVAPSQKDQLYKALIT